MQARANVPINILRTGCVHNAKLLADFVPGSDLLLGRNGLSALASPEVTNAAAENKRDGSKIHLSSKSETVPNHAIKRSQLQLLIAKINTSTVLGLLASVKRNESSPKVVGKHAIPAQQWQLQLGLLARIETRISVNKCLEFDSEMTFLQNASEKIIKYHVHILVMHVILSKIQ